MQVELYTGDIPSVFERFSDLVGAQHWKKRVDLLKADIRGNKLLREHLRQENEFAFGLQATNISATPATSSIILKSCSFMFLFF